MDKDKDNIESLGYSMDTFWSAKKAIHVVRALLKADSVYIEKYHCHCGSKLQCLIKSVGSKIPFA